MIYDDPNCAYCPPTVRACRNGEAATKGPGFCPSKVDTAPLEAARVEYEDEATRRFAKASAEVEAEGYGVWCRAEEIIHFAKKMGYHKLGIATCIGLVDFAHLYASILESHGFEVLSVACKTGSVPKEKLGLRDDQKVRPGTFEPMCNPIAQAEMLNAHASEFNILMGLCVGHDSLFFRHAQAPCTVLVTKDRVLAHNPLGALELADTYYQRLWGPLGPKAPGKQPNARH